MDILFIVDNSASMQEEQTNLTLNFPDFIGVIHDHVTSAGKELDYRVAVTTTGRDVQYELRQPWPLPALQYEELGDDGALLQKCGMSERWLSRGDSSVESTFSCLANVGTSGPGLEMPLHVVELAFDARMTDGSNTGFLREDALLALVILTDEEDCSRRDNNFTIDDDVCDSSDPKLLPVVEPVELLNTVTGGSGRWATAVIAGAGPGPCESSFGQAAEAHRLKDFVGAIGPTGVFSSICEGDLTSALEDALATFATACEELPPIE
jgi:hypothetical protein